MVCFSWGSRRCRLLAALGTVALTLVRGSMGAPAVAAWESRGIGGGGALFSASISPFVADEIYMATDMTGVFHTTNFGQSWTTLPFTRLRGGVDTNVRFTSDPNVLYATHIGQFDARLPVRSTDGGETFAPLPVDPTGGETLELYVDPHDTQRLLISSWNELYYSKDGGASFQLIDQGDGSGNGLHLAGAFWDGSHIYLGTSKGLLTSHDGGASFAADASAGIAPGQAMVSFSGAKQGNATRFYALTYDQANVWGGIVGSEARDNDTQVYRLNAGEANWTQVRSQSDQNHPFFVATALGNPDVAYLAGADNETGAPSVLKTVDGGLSWQQTFQTTGNQNIATGWAGSGGDLEWYWGETAMGFAVSPTNPDRAIITDFGFVHVTNDGGASWRQAYVDPAYQNPSGVATPKNQHYVTAGVEQTSAWWMHWPGGDRTGKTVVAGFSDIAGLRSTDAGRSWTAGTAQGLPHNSTYHVIENSLSNELYAATSSVHDMYQSTYLEDRRIDGGVGNVLRSTDDGASWQTLHEFDAPVVWLAQPDGQSETLYASVVHRDRGGIYMTRNLSAGADFTRLPSPARTEGHPFHLHLLDDGSLVASWSGRRSASGAFTESSGVFLSEDGGQTWLDRSAPQMTRWTKDVVIDPHDSTQNTWLVGVFSHWGTSNNEVGGLYRTSDRGLNWTELGDFYRVNSVSIDPQNPDVAYVTTETEGLWITDNLRASQPTFRLDPSYPFQHPMRVFFNPRNPGEIWTTSFGGGLRVQTSSSPLASDWDSDGDADGSDFLGLQRSDSGRLLEWEAEFGTQGGAGHAVPEPTSWLQFLFLAGQGAASAARRRKKK